MSSHSRGAAPAGGYEGNSNSRGEPHGEGKRVFSSGHVYEGSWKDGRCEGFGRFTYPDGQIFEGEWKDGRRNGPGKLMMPSGETIAGTWVDDSLTGPVRRWLTADEAPAATAAPVVTRRHEASSTLVYDAPPPSAPVPVGETEDVAWLRESHDVIWQLNVELQMENERLVGENRRLRLKLRQMLQNQNHGGGCGCQGGGQGGGKNPPKVVEGRLKKKTTGKKEEDKGGSKKDAKLLQDLINSMGGKDDAASFINFVRRPPARPPHVPRPPVHLGRQPMALFPQGVPLLSRVWSQVDKEKDKGSAGAFLDYVDGKKPDDDERRKRIVEELCSRAESELGDRLMSREWEGLKRIGRAGDVEALARKKLGAVLAGVRLRPVRSDTDLEAAAADVRAGVDAVVGWPEGLRRMERSTQMSGERMAEAKELRLDGCGLGVNGAGAVAVLLRESRTLESVDISSNALGDAGCEAITDALRSGTPLRTLRINSNGLREKASEALCSMLGSNRSVRVELKHNNFDSRSESNLRSAGGARVVLNDRDPPLDPPPAPPQSAEGFLAFSGGAKPPTSDAEAFLAFSGGASRGGSSDLPPSGPTKGTKGSSDADAFLAFGGGGGGGGGGGAMDANSAQDFLAFADAAPASKLSLGSGSAAKKGVSFSGGGSKLGAGANDASAFLASLGD